MAPVPGLLYVTMQPHGDLPAEEFHDWYNNEHGPTRLRLPFVTNGFRYRATDLGDAGAGSKDMPEWMAAYDITDNNELNSDAYLRLRGPPVKSERETNVMKRIDVDRKCFDVVYEQARDGYQNLEDAYAEDADRGVLVAVSVRCKPGHGIKELVKFYEEEHVPMLSKVPGYRRSRCFKTSQIVKALSAKDQAEQADPEFLSLHEYDTQNGVGTSPEYKAASSTPRLHKLMDEAVSAFKRRTYAQTYTFGPAPRFLHTKLQPFTSPDGATKTLPVNGPSPSAIESFVTTPDGVDLPYRLEGSSSPHAPLLVLINSVLVDWHIWDAFLTSLTGYPAFANYRILRYHARGRSSKTIGTQPITLDLLAADVIALLDALRVPRAAAVIGVSLGGATALNVALKHPDRVTRFVACDTNAAAPAGNAKAWGERIAVAEAESATAALYGKDIDTVASGDELVVGTRLAELTVKRWFAGTSWDGGDTERRCREVQVAVERNSLAGFRAVVQALFKYDLWDEMKSANAQGTFLAGKEDGKVPVGMRGMAEGYAGGKGTFFEIEDAGHLPMVEKPDDVAGIVARELGWVSK
ncbi:uncharacterized protein K452DRAFT_289756 [Aplosporella prunicola CBS 121167]|uniref:AB hydrolase-1 domain-containing protein n=1 Tax=Aplosporella prunicola CBS 121167 TaxID=1176127 RepID=A0A6A6B4T3_9PEZI|nr:uncharacterized protein K452DRAFT_289756 [Aplosporella prunicola CBS 121167]KAF2139209.1 hypothetical protein K452DRAFT_289756 [Aplosporella prunicola CBS 121167]